MTEWKNGLPPVGEVVAMFDWKNSGAWFEVEVIAIHNKKGAVGWCETRGNFYSTDNPDYIKPLKSEAELKREKAVEEMFSAITDDELASFEWNAHAERICKCLHNAGYRKVNELTDERIADITNATFPTSNVRVSWMNGAKWARSQIMGEES